MDIKKKQFILNEYMFGHTVYNISHIMFLFCDAEIW